VCVLQPTHSAGNPREQFMAAPLLIRVWDFGKRMKMAYRDWDGPRDSTGAKGFHAERT